MIPLKRAQAIAAKVVEQLQPFCHRIEVAGSIRRLRPEVGDLDLVVEAKDRRGFEDRIVRSCRLAANGEHYLRAMMADQTQIDVWFAHSPRNVDQRDFFARDPKPENFGCLLLSKTGSVAHNIALVERAKKLGRSWNPQWGVYQGCQCIASATEADIYNALGLEFIEPTQREFTGRGEQLRIINRPHATIGVI